MFTPSKTTPKFGEIRWGYFTTDTVFPSDVHKYVGVHPYLIISNDRYNQVSGQCEAIAFTTKRFEKHNPVHVDFQIGEVEGLDMPSTLAVESRITARNIHFSDPIGTFTTENWQKAVPAILRQNPILRYMQPVNMKPEQVLA
jgi:mRNA-degrading endonuclease toxin of MazEF toxin-antitoxin module